MDLFNGEKNYKMANYTFYNKLLNEFPSEDYFKKVHALGNKKYFNNKDTDFNEFLKTSLTWKEFYNHLHTNFSYSANIYFF